MQEAPAIGRAVEALERIARALENGNNVLAMISIRLPGQALPMPPSGSGSLGSVSVLLRSDLPPLHPTRR